ncbi:RNA polymerase sigma factor [Pedobacter frigidisoli]|nr:sigma-70 family RNA polymerase sigma factor [Pedobacter frigidisoli]
MTALPTDVELWISLKQGNREAFTALYGKYSKMLFSYGLRITPDEHVVADALQSTFVKFWTNRETIALPVQVKPFLITSFRNNLSTIIAKGNRTESLDNFNEEQFVMNFTLESEYIKKEDVDIQSKKLNDALNQLSPRQKEIIYLRYFEELDYNEIAAIMDISVKGAYKLSARALFSLQKIMEIGRNGLFLMLAAYRISHF